MIPQRCVGKLQGIRPSTSRLPLGRLLIPGVPVVFLLAKTPKKPILNGFANSYVIRQEMEEKRPHRNPTLRPLGMY